MSGKINKKKVEYYVDFESWYFMAESREDAIRQAEKRLRNEGIPEVISVEEAP